MKTLDLMEMLGRHPVFDLAIFASMAGIEPNYAKVRLHRLVEEGRIFRLERNSYTVLKDPLIVASRIVWPGYISLWYALGYHGLTEQIPHAISVLTTKRTFRAVIDFQQARIEFIKIPPSALFGYEKTVVRESEVFMATPEKALVDAVVLRRISMAEIFGMMKERKMALDLRRLADFVRRTGSIAAAKRMGYMLEQLGSDQWMRLAKGIYPVAIPLDSALPRKGALVRKWGIIDNAGVGI